MTMTKNELVLILDNIRSRENVGSIFRTADAAGVSMIYLCGITPIPPHPKIEKASLGAEKTVPYKYIRDAWRLVTQLQKEGYQVVALEQTKESEDIFKFKAKYPVALVVGNEVDGVSISVLKRVDKKISIPMYGKKESLNVSVATGIALYSLAS
jgi:23S rRNA (guanosine2251-2'-O)-methyltransferase